MVAPKGCTASEARLAAWRGLYGTVEDLVDLLVEAECTVLTEAHRSPAWEGFEFDGEHGR